MHGEKILFIIGSLLLFSSCNKTEFNDPPGFEVNISADSSVFAFIGDYGYDGANEQDVADLVKSWKPDFIITSGDNNYPSGEMETMEQNISKYYGDFIYNFDAEKQYQCHGIAFEEQFNRFFPSPGNHDTYSKSGLKPYLNFFTLPGNEEYYTFTWGDMAFFSLNSVASSMEEQEKWLEDEIASAAKLWNIVYFHHSPYSIGKHGNERKMQFDYHGMGVDIVFTGHDHNYSRIEKEDEPDLYYIISGNGGKSLYACGDNELDPNLFSVNCFDEDFGAVRGNYVGNKLTLEFFAVSDTLNPVDRIVIEKDIP